MKNGFRKILAVMVVAVLIISICVTPTFASQVESSALITQAENNKTDFACVVLSDGTIEIAGYIGNTSDVVIPSSIDGRAVTSIGNSAFFRNSAITSVTIPDTVTKIGNYTFGYCDSLKKVTIPSSVTYIAQDAFINFSDELTIYCFKNTAGLDIAQTNNIRHACFSYKPINEKEAEIVCYYENAKEVEIPSVVDGLVVTSIGNSAFIFSDVTDVTIPDTVTKIDDFAFCQCASLKSVKMPRSLTYLGEHAFGYCSSLPEITIPHGTPLVWDGAFTHCSKLESVTIPDSVEFISEYAFSACTSLKDVYIPSSVRYIYDNSFVQCADSLVIHGLYSSYAYTYAQKNNINFVSLSDV